MNIVFKRGYFDCINGRISVMAEEYKKRNFNVNMNDLSVKWNILAGARYRTGNNIGKGYRKFTYN